MASLRGVASVVAVAALVAGCGSKPDVVETDGLTVLVSGDRDGGTLVRIYGVLADTNDCLGLRQAGDVAEEDQPVAVFPAGTEVSGDGRSVTRPDGTELALDDTIESGGETYGSGMPPRPDNVPAVPAECGDVPAALLADPQLES